MKTISVQYNNTIFDLSLKTYGIENVFKFIQENAFIDSINYDFNANPGKTIEYDETFKVPQPKIVLGAQIQSGNSGQFKSSNGQSIFDLCIQTYGSLEFLYQFINENNVGSLLSNDIDERVFTFDKRKIKDNIFYNNITGKGVRLKTENFAPGDFVYRITEDGTLRITEAGQPRIIE